MAGRKPVTSTSEKNKKYRSLLIKHALNKKTRSLQPSQHIPFTFRVRFRSGTIFSQRHRLLTLSVQIIQTLFFLFSAVTLDFFHAVGWATLRVLRKLWRTLRWLIVKRSVWWSQLSHAPSTIHARVSQFFSTCCFPIRRALRNITRWHRRHSWSFRRSNGHALISPKPSEEAPVDLPLSSPTDTTTSSTHSIGHLLANVLLAPFKPFYFTARLFPIQSLAAVSLTALILFSSLWTHQFIFEDLPNPERLRQELPAMTATITDRNGEVLYQLYEEENRIVVPLTEISPSLIYATIAIEDKDFYTHRGFSLRGISRALWSNYQNESIQGGSTITQQLVKNRLLSSERTFQRKIREIILAIMVEQVYSKTEILEMYFNQIGYGGAIYGAEAASQRYFGKPARDLSVPEAALLAGLPAAPTIYSPFGPQPDLAKNRQTQVLRRMVEDGYITDETAKRAETAELPLQKDSIHILAPHFVMYVRALLAQQYGEHRLLTEGLQIRTSLDLNLQQTAQDIVTEEIATLARLRVKNGAVLVTNPNTGEILAMVGSKNYFDFENDGQVNVTIRPRQPGSSIKPLTYALALERGMTPNSLILDQPITFDIAGSRPYSPRNYDGTYHGNVTLKEALASSYNIPAVKLLNQLGVNSLIDKAEAMGITTWKERTRFGLSLTLGGGEVLMTDMAKLYGVFATQGQLVELNPILEVRSYDGQLMYQNSCALSGLGCERRRVLDSTTAYQISNILSDNAARAPAFGTQSTLYIPGQEVAVKTGTTNNLRDNWTIGYTSDRVVATWVGNNDNQPMSYVASGITGASPIWNKIMRSLLDANTPHFFAQPEGMIKLAICATTGTLPCSGCPRIVEEYFVAGTEPTTACNLAVPIQPSISTPPIP